jgi:hypothetical protein
MPVVLLLLIPVVECVLPSVLWVLWPCVGRDGLEMHGSLVYSYWYSWVADLYILSDFYYNNMVSFYIVD